jgi:hypothetical protein
MAVDLWSWNCCIQCFITRAPSGNSHFFIFMTVGVAMIIFWLYYNATTKQNSDMKFIAKQPPVYLGDG